MRANPQGMMWRMRPCVGEASFTPLAITLGVASFALFMGEGSRAGALLQWRRVRRLRVRACRSGPG